MQPWKGSAAQDHRPVRCSSIPSPSSIHIQPTQVLPAPPPLHSLTCGVLATASCSHPCHVVHPNALCFLCRQRVCQLCKQHGCLAGKGGSARSMSSEMEGASALGPHLPRSLCLLLTRVTLRNSSSRKEPLCHAPTARHQPLQRERVLGKSSGDYLSIDDVNDGLKDTDRQLGRKRKESLAHSEAPPPAGLHQRGSRWHTGGEEQDSHLCAWSWGSA